MQDRRARHALEFQDVGRGTDRCERIAQFMRQHRQERVLAGVCRFQFRFCLFQHGDIGAGAEPLHHRPERILQGHHPRVEHAVLIGCGAQREGALERHAIVHALPPQPPHAIDHVGGAEMLPGQRLHHVRRGARVIAPAVVIPVHDAVGVGNPGHLRNRVGQQAQALLAFAQRLRGAHGVGDVISLDKDAGHGAVAAADGLIHEIDDSFLQRLAGPALQLQRHGIADKRLARLADAIERIQKALLRHLGQGRKQAHADDVALADQVHERIVGQFKDVAGLAHHRSEAGSLAEQLAHAIDFLCAVKLGQYLVGGLDADTIHAGDRSLPVAHGGVGKREPGLLVVAFAIRDQRHVFPVAGDTLHGLLHDRMNIVPDLGPDIGKPCAECLRVLAAQDLGIGIVVEEFMFLAYGDKHGKLRVQCQIDGGPQPAWPGQRRTEACIAPVLQRDQLCNLASAIKE